MHQYGVECSGLTCDRFELWKEVIAGFHMSRDLLRYT